MSELKLCQGTKCHQYFTKDRLKGQKGNKTNQTRRRSYLIFNEFCSNQCYNDWFIEFGNRAINHFGRLTEPKHLTEENAWYKDYNYDWRSEQHSNWRFINKITKEERPITREQYEDRNYTLNTI
tara:strand:+ start:686 stop:1057 length:372 start_codon:yes stop_codon:yes gene_type:complete